MIFLPKIPLLVPLFLIILLEILLIVVLIGGIQKKLLLQQISLKEGEKLVIMEMNCCPIELLKRLFEKQIRERATTFL
uniref:Uncharacterized protein n=1 Tax=Meloidogyne enterolobii TaxID=390850 RepID=A0A6V7Y646_MELEN|nr:unnamed protein product [Meloidogyne enterolobii]